MASELCHRALGWSWLLPPCPTLSLPLLTSLATRGKCTAGIHHVTAFLFHSPFNLDPLFISLLVLLPLPTFIPKFLLSKS